MKVSSDRNKIQVDLIRLHKKYQLYCIQYFMLDNIHEIRLIAIREVSSPFGELRAGQGFLKSSFISLQRTQTAMK